MIAVADASVALKWFFRDQPEESDVDHALWLLRELRAGRLELIEPPHFIAEVAAVLARVSPRTAYIDLRDLLEINLQIVSDPIVYELAVELAIRLNHHLFDTLYHAVALSRDDAVLVTADRRYFDKARSFGRLVWLPDFANSA